MPKYDPLRLYLEQRHVDELPMTFAEVERVLGFPLPPSAKGATWWSNNTGSHVGVRAWRDAGFKASRVNVAGESVVFVRAEDEPAASHAPADRVTVPLDRLSTAARKLFDDYVREASGDAGAAMARALHEAAVARKKRLLDRFPLTGVRSDVDSVDLIREDRDAR